MPRSQDAEQCIPLPRLADYGLDMNTDAVKGAESEERASCVFVRRILDEKRRASACFARIAYPYPPPPPERLEAATTDAASLRRQRERLGDLEAYPEPRKTDEAQWAQDSSNALKGTNALIDGLGENNPILKNLLKGVKEELLRAEIEAVPDVTAINTGNAAAGAGEAPSVTASATSSFASTTSAGTSSSNSYGYGRRLLQRVEYNTRMTDALITHELMQFYGKGGIPGITAGSCEALCEATKQDTNASRTDECGAFAFKRAMPFSYVDQTGWCYLLQHSGACKLEDFGVELYTRLCCFSNRPSTPTPLHPAHRHYHTQANRVGASVLRERARPGQCVSALEPAHAPTRRPCTNAHRLRTQTRSASGCPRRSTTRACSRTPTRPPPRTRCRTTGTRRRARAGCRCRAPSSSPCP